MSVRARVNKQGDMEYPNAAIYCRDRRLMGLAEQIFSSEIKIPSLKFSLILSYAAFLVSCFAGIMAESFKLDLIANFIKLTLLAWFGLLASLLAPIFIILSPETDSNLLYFFLPLQITLSGWIAFHLIKYFKQPAHLAIYQSGICPTWSIGNFSHSHRMIYWNDIDRLQFVGVEKANADDWQVQLRGTEKVLLNVRLGCITDLDDRVRLLDCIQTNCPEAKIDPAILQAWTPAQGSSYTEIWLQSLAAPPKRARLAPLEEGMELQDGKYKITKLLAAGGQAVVYLAKAKDQEKELVLKEMIIPVYGDENIRKKALEAFEHESMLLQNLNNDKIVKLLDFFVEDHRGYMALEYIEGKSLQNLVIESGARPESEVLQLALQMCETLIYLHHLTPPIVHRDFTPDNLILTTDGVLKLIDFNVAHESKFTTTATVVGKHSYLPPEQFRGKPVPASDIYAMGGTLFFLLTGEQPEPITSAEPILFNENVSLTLSKIVAKATEPDLKDRYHSVAELLQDLQAIEQDPIITIEESIEELNNTEFPLKN